MNTSKKSNTVENIIENFNNKHYSDVFQSLQFIEIDALSEEQKKELGKICLELPQKSILTVKNAFICYRYAILCNNEKAIEKYINGSELKDKTIEDYRFVCRHAKRLDNQKRNSLFYATWAFCLEKLHSKGEDIDITTIKSLLEKAIKINPKQPAAYTYMARLYSNKKLSTINDLTHFDLAEQYYNMAIKNGSKMAEKELKRLQQKQIPDLSFDLMNASVNLDNFINLFSDPQFNNKNFSILLTGPYGSGKEIFATHLLKTMDVPFEYCLDVEKHNPNSALIIPHVDTKVFLSERQTWYLINLLAMHKLPIILLAEDENKVFLELKNNCTFRINFSYMDTPQKEAAYKLFFNFDAPPLLLRLNGLVINDFSRVKKQGKILKILGNPDKVLNLLKEEAQYKAGADGNYLKPDTNFNHNLINSDTNLPDLICNLQKHIEKPFTMLIHGPAGTGKSYFLRHLADQLGFSTLEKTAAELFSPYHGMTATNVHQLFEEAKKKKAIIILDEVEEILCDRKNSNQSWKNDIVNAFLTCLERTEYPIVCTTNFLEKIDKAILRRFVFKLHFNYLTKEQNQNAFKHFFKLDPPLELDGIGGLTNGDYATVKKKAIFFDKMDDTDYLIEKLREESLTKTNSIISQNIKLTNFDINFINTDTALLEKTIKSIKNGNKNKVSFLLYGPSGTGKSYYLRYLASQLGYEVIERRASDICSKWIGETEQNIADAFAEAKNRRAFLIFDEIDSFLFDKKNNFKEWQNKIINEFLIQMENHPYPFAGTTNYLEQLEPASLRRFSLKVLFDYLKPEQYEYVYEKTFGFKPKDDISYLKHLTPALFNLAHDKAELSDVLNDQDKVFNIFLNEAKMAGNERKDEIQKTTFERIKIKEIPLYTKPIAENYSEILKASVKIWNETKTSHGSGFFISTDGFILTNKHVVDDNKYMLVELFSGREVPAEVLRTDDLDVALLKISSENVCTPLPLRLEEPNPGTTVFSMGNPDNKNYVLSKGNITRYTKNTKGYKRIESDNFSYGGISGGPFMDEYGNVLGLNVEGWMDPATNYKTKLGLTLKVPIIDALNVLNIKIKEK